MFPPAHKADHRACPELIATIFLLAAYVAWILSLPAWPSQDGPVHLYYVHVMGELLSHHATVYSRYYTIKHVLPPYALYYYTLLALSKICSLVLADRLVLCSYMVLFVFGFRYVARVIGPSADRSTLLVTLLALNWSSGMGFLNYCLSLALVFWAAGLWLRLAGSRNLVGRFIFLLLVGAITLTHPVPLLILLAFCVVDWLQRFFADRKKVRPPLNRGQLGADFVLLAISTLALLYVRHFATAHPLSQPQSVSGTYVHQVRAHVLGTLQMHHLALILGHNPAIRLYLFGLLAIVAIGYGLSIDQFVRNRRAHRWRRSDTWLVYSVVLLVLIPFLPSDLNDAFYFTERLSILVWIAPLLAASGWTARPGATAAGQTRTAPFGTILRSALLTFALVMNLALLWEANRILRPLAIQTISVPEAETGYPGQLGLLLADFRQAGGRANGPSWNPYYWAGAHLFRRDGAVLDNSPWLDAAIIPLGAKPALTVAAQSTGNDASPHRLSQLLAASPAAAVQTLRSAEFVLIMDPGSSSPGTASLVLNRPGDARLWACRPAATWYQLCEPNSMH